MTTTDFRPRETVGGLRVAPETRGALTQEERDVVIAVVGETVIGGPADNVSADVKSRKKPRPRYQPTTRHLPSQDVVED